MVDSSDEPPLSNRSRSWAKINLNPFGREGEHNPPSTTDDVLPHYAVDSATAADPAAETHGQIAEKKNKQETASSVDTQGAGEESTSIGTTDAKLSLGKRFLRDTRSIIFSSWINWLLLCVPVGIALGAIAKARGDASPVSPSVVFAINAVAIIPLASLLSFATESVASKLGDTIGALCNVTFGNAVELIIFIIALVAKEIRIVQASLLGSILANLLLILGMCFLCGGLRFREQLYNSTVSQMSACLLSLSVISLLLPTAFHASFSNLDTADQVVLKVSRGTSVVLLLVYILYLLFQLKSHAYMYQSTPQHLIDEESHPGVLAEMLNSSSSSSESSSSSSSDSDSSAGSRTTAKRIRRVLRRKRRKSNASSKETPPSPSALRTPSSTTNNTSVMNALPTTESPTELSPKASRNLGEIFSGDEADTDAQPRRHRHGSQMAGVVSHDFEGSHRESKKSKKKSRRAKRLGHRKIAQSIEDNANAAGEPSGEKVNSQSPPQVGFVPEVQEIPPEMNSTTRQFHMRSVSSRIRPGLPKGLSSAAFNHHEAIGRSLPLPSSHPPTGSRVATNEIRRANSLPEIASRPASNPRPAPISAQPLPHLMPVESQITVDDADIVEPPVHLSRTSAIILLLVSTGLVAVCADFLVDSIDYLVENSGVSQAFIGLIILPIVGNAAEHVTAVTVASKNKMDLAINVALGSSIQIALFVTPVIVLLGWALDTDMSLYFSLFETVSLFASAFIVNYLMIDGRSNYLEGALLISAYVIIAVAAFFYPTCDVSLASGPADVSSASC